MSWAALRVEKRRSGRASSRCRPRTWSATRRALRGATRTKRARALTIGRSGASFLARLRVGAFAVSAFGSAAFAGSFFAGSCFAGAFFAGSFFAAGFFAAAFLAGALVVEASEALESADSVLRALPRVAVSLFGFADEERVPLDLRWRVPELPDFAVVFAPPPELPDDFFAVDLRVELCFFSVSFFSS